MEENAEAIVQKTQCVTCGAVYDSLLERCSRCGAALPLRKCPRCGQLLEPDTTRCVACGYQFSSQQAGGIERRMNGLKQLVEPLERVFQAQERMLNDLAREISILNEKVAELKDMKDEESKRKRQSLEKELNDLKKEEEDLLNIRRGVTEIDNMYKNLLDIKAREFRSAMEALADEVRKRREMETARKGGDMIGGSRASANVATTESASKGETGVRSEVSVLCGICSKKVDDVDGEGERCECGQVVHTDCAADVSVCPGCNDEFRFAKAEDEFLNIECPMCGEEVSVGINAELLRANCHSCGSVLKKVDEGYNYLVVDESPETAYREFKLVQNSGIPGLCLSTTFPEKVEREFGLADADLYWFSDTNMGNEIRTLDPRRLDFEAIRVIGRFFKESPNGVVMIDGLEHLLVANGFGKVLQFVKKVNDLASLNKATIFVSLSPLSLEKDQYARLRKEFDKVQVLAS